MLRARIKTLTQLTNGLIPLKTLVFEDNSALPVIFMGKEVELSVNGNSYGAIFDKGTRNEFYLSVRREWLTDIEIDWTQVPDGQIVEVKCIEDKDPRWFLGRVKLVSGGEFVLDLVESCPYRVDYTNINDYKVKFIHTEEG